MSDRARGAGGYGRPAAEPLLDELASNAGELSKRWAIALIEGRDPGAMAGVDLSLLAGEGPAVIDVVLSAAAASAGGGDGVPASGGALARIAGAGGAGELARAAEALRSVLWEAAVEASSRGRADARAARRLFEIGDDIAAACAELLARELDARSEQTSSQTPEPAEGPAPAGNSAPASGSAAAAAERIVIVDERDATAHRSAPRTGPGGPASQAESAEPPFTASAAAAASAAAPIAARDARPQQGPAAWIGSIGAQLEAFERDGRPFAVLLIELLEQPAGHDAGAPGRALEQRVGGWRGLTLTRERAGRWWLVAPGADGAGAESLRGRLEAAAGEGPGVGPVAVGVAVCPDEGRDAARLAAQADLDLYSSRTRSSSPPARGTGGY